MSSKSSRRDLLKLASMTFAVTALGCDSPNESIAPDAGNVETDASSSCAPTGAQTAGPFYPGEPATRMQIVGDRVGVPLELHLEILAASDCRTLTGAEVDVWCADSEGSYSGYATFGTEGQTWLRGQQITSAAGTIVVLAIMPGAYPGRAVHMHVKVRAPGLSELTTQIYFPDSLVMSVLDQPEYRGGQHVANADDAFYAPDTLLAVTGTIATGIVARATLHA